MLIDVNSIIRSTKFPTPQTALGSSISLWSRAFFAAPQDALEVTAKLCESELSTWSKEDEKQVLISISKSFNHFEPLEMPVASNHLAR